MYDKNFGEFFVDQIKNAHTVILSRTDISKEETVLAALEIVRKHNPNCVVITTPITKLSDSELLKAYEGFDTKLLDDLDIDDDDEECDDPNCSCHHHHDHDHEHEHHHHHHDHDEEECDDPECECHHHHHHDDDDDDDDECCHDHEHHHHHHHADEVFNSIGIETVKKYDINALKALLDKMANGEYGMIVRSKGIIEGLDGKWYVFNLEPEEVDIIETTSIPMGKIVVIGSHIDEQKIKNLF